MEMLVDPTPCPLEEMVPWEKFLQRINDVPAEILKNRAEAICEMEIEDNDVRVGFRRELETADADGALANALIFVGLKLGVFPAFAYLPTAASCYEIKRFYWSTFSQSWKALEAIETGCIRLPTNLVRQSIESDLANRPLFVLVNAEKDILNLRPPSDAALSRMAARIISDHQAQSAAKMRKRDFVKRVVELAPGCNKERAERAWTQHAPAAWKRPGRPRRG